MIFQPSSAKWWGSEESLGGLSYEQNHLKTIEVSKKGHYVLVTNQLIIFEVLDQRYESGSDGYIEGLTKSNPQKNVKKTERSKVYQKTVKWCGHDESIRELSNKKEVSKETHIIIMPDQMSKSYNV